MSYVISFLKFIITLVVLILNLLKNIVLVIFAAVQGIWSVATGFCAEIAIPLYILVAVAVVYKIISLGGSGE